MNIIANDNLGRRLEFFVDFESGLVAGSGADRVLRLVEFWPGRGHLYGTQVEVAPDPLRNPRDLAVLLLSHEYTFDGELAEFMPEPDEVPEGAVA